MEINEVNDGSISVPNVPDPYDMVYNKLPTETHMLSSVDDAYINIVVQRGSSMSHQGFAVVMGRSS